MSRYFLAWIMCVLSLATNAAFAQTKRVALVVGNSAYTVSPLTNPTNDADAVAAALTNLGFTTVLRKDLGIEAMRSELAAFGRQATGAEMAVVFYAGHGTELSGRNFLIPVDARLQRAADIELEAIGLETVIAQLDGARLLKLVILDACRNNIFPVAGGTRSLSRGLARVEPGGNILIAYSAKAGTLADDGDGARNSPYTTSLLKNISTPGLDVRLMFGGVRDDVIVATSGKQEPYLYGTAGRHGLFLKEMPLSPKDPVALDGASYLSELKKRIDASSTSAELDAIGLIEPKLAAEISARKRSILDEAARRDPAMAIVPGSGRSFRDCPTCPELVVVPAGSFTMGSPETEEGRDNSERPQRRVTFKRPFAVGKYEVTFEEWDACLAVGGCNGHRADDAGLGRGNLPVINVNWDDAKAYSLWLSSTTGKSYKLLSESEWEYSARAGTTAPFSTGGTITNDQANFDGSVTYGGSRKGQNRRVLATVGAFPPNAWGLYDMHGNVEEWIEDCWNGSYFGAPTDGTAWMIGECSKRGIRGGSWSHHPKDLRSGKRTWAFPNDKVDKDKLGGQTEQIVWALQNRGHRFGNRGFRIGRSISF